MNNDHVHQIFQPILAAIAPASCVPLEDGRACGDEGELCDGCSERAAAEWSWLRHASKYAVMPLDEEYYAELRDAGHSHQLCRAYDIAELVDFREQSDGSVSIEPKRVEPPCEHSYLPGGMGCIVCQTNAFEAHHRALIGCLCIYDNWGRFLSALNCPVHNRPSNQPGDYRGG